MGQVFGPLNRGVQFLQGLPNDISREWRMWLEQVGEITGVNPPRGGTGSNSLADVALMAYTADHDLQFPVKTTDGRMAPPLVEPTPKAFDARLMPAPDPESRKALDAQMMALARLDPPPPSSWRGYTPTVTAGSGSFTTVAATGQYQVVGKTVQVAIEIDVTTVGTATTSVLATLPVASNKTLTSGYQALSGVEFGSTNKALTGLIGYPDTSHVRLVFYDGTFPGASGNKLIVQGSYEAS